MNQADFFGVEPPPSAQFKDIRNTRPANASAKAELVWELGRLLRTVPPAVRNGSVNLVRQWRAAQAQGAKVAGNSRSSVADLTTAIKALRSF